MPKTIPTPHEKQVVKTIAVGDSLADNPPISSTEISPDSPAPIKIPMTPPIPEMIADSHKTVR